MSSTRRGYLVVATMLLGSAIGQLVVILYTNPGPLSHAEVAGIFSSAIEVVGSFFLLVHVPDK